MEPDQIICGDNIDVLSKIGDGAIALTVTSPWYHNAIDYKQHVADPEQNYRGTLDMTVDEYIEIMGKTFAEVFRVTAPGGYCCIVVGNETNKGTLEPLPALLVARLRNDNWRLHEEIIWHKVTGGTNRAGNFVQRPYPSYFRANIMHESILVLRKEENKLRQKERAFDGIHPDILWKEIANSVWHVAPVPPGFLRHPCPFPEELPYRLISLYSDPSDIVLDPFNGAGQTTKVSKYTGRKFLGIDIQQQYVDYARSRLDEKPHIRDESIVLGFEKYGVPKWDKIPTKN